MPFGHPGSKSPAGTARAQKGEDSGHWDAVGLEAHGRKRSRLLRLPFGQGSTNSSKRGYTRNPLGVPKT